MSTSILYLAIVAIWACFLVPAWLRRPHAESADGESYTEASDYAEAADWAPAPTYAESDAEVNRRGADFAPAPTYADDVPDPETATAYAAAEAGRTRPRPAQPSQSRRQMLRARRRMLTILVMLTAITGAFTYLGDIRWWICVPPAGMLVLYVLLLREIAQADAELARKRDVWLARAEAAEARRQRAHAAWAPHPSETAKTERGYDADPASRPTEQTAKIIDISRRVSDQLYDQYADAAVRAVGD
jgi:hypothetical protein